MTTNASNIAPSLTYGPATAQSFDRAIALEWLETNGLGDFACGTVAGPNTRRSHGLFVAGGARPMLLLAGLDVSIERDGERIGLSTHQFAGTVHPEGYRLCAQFRSAPFPEWRYEFNGGALTQRVFMPAGRRCVMAVWQLDAASALGDWRLKIRPLFAYRDVGALTHANLDANMALRELSGGFAVVPYAGCPQMSVRCPGAAIRYDPLWYYRFRHAEDAALGRESDEDFFTPCEMTYEVSSGQMRWMIAGIEPTGDAAESDPGAIESGERLRREGLLSPGAGNDPVSRILVRAAEAFCVRSPGAEGTAGIVVGYPDAPHDLRAGLVALPGILLIARRLAEAKSYLADSLGKLLARPSLGDEALWFIRAAELYTDHSRDWEFLRAGLAPGCLTLTERLACEKPESGLLLDADGLLLCAGAAPMTWMNAVAAGAAVTPRAGKAVEINALWHHALGLVARWATRLGREDAAQRWSAVRELCGRSFRRRFWNAERGCLFDVVDTPAGNDPAIRPNQLLAVALPADLLDRAQANAVLEIVEKRLLAPGGLRTLSLEEPSFVPGGPDESMRHQGSVHAWLVGFYADAVFRVHGRTPRAYARVATALEWLTREHLAQGCIGQVGERFDGAAPHEPRGLVAHAPAVGEIMRAWGEVMGRA